MHSAGNDDSGGHVARIVVRGEEIQRLRLLRAWSQADLGRRAGLRQATISNVERHNVARYATILAIASVFGVNVTEITNVVAAMVM